MKKTVYIFIALFMWSCTESVDFELNVKNKPVFYVFMENGKPVEAFIGETVSADTWGYNQLDTLQTEVSLYENDIFFQNLFPETDFFVDTFMPGTIYQQIDSLPLFNHGVKYTADNTCDTSTNYILKLKYKNYPEIEIGDKIPSPIQIDSVKITPNIGYQYGTYFIKHKLTIYFMASEKNTHFMGGYIIKPVSEDNNTFYGESPFYRYFINDNQINIGGENDISFDIMFENGYGDFYLTLYLYTISDGFYNDLLNEYSYNQYINSATVFDPTKPRLIYTMTPGAYTNIYAYSYTTYNAGLIHVIPPPVK